MKNFFRVVVFLIISPSFIACEQTVTTTPSPAPLLTPTAIATFFDTSLSWHPAENTLAYISEDAQKLELADAQTMSAKKIVLPTSFQELLWSPPEAISRS